MFICYNTDIIVAARVIIIGLHFLPLLFNFLLMGTISSELIASVHVRINFYAINNCGSDSVMFGVNFICGD